MKNDNKGITLIELLVSLAILSIFMVTVTFFLSTSTKSVNQTKKQVQVQQAAKELYESLNSTIMQASSVRIRTDHSITGPTTSDSDITSRRSVGFPTFGTDTTVSGDVEFISKAAYDSIDFVEQNSYSLDTYTGKFTTNGVGKPSVYYTDSLGKKHLDTKYVSAAEYEAAKEYLDGSITNKAQHYAAFDDGEYEVKAISTGPVTVGGITAYYTVVYDAASKKVYINKDASKSDYSIKDASLVADNCTQFTVNAQEGKSNALELKLTLSNGGYSYTLGGTVNIRNNKVMD